MLTNNNTSEEGDRVTTQYITICWYFFHIHNESFRELILLTNMISQFGNEVYSPWPRFDIR